MSLAAIRQQLVAEGYEQVDTQLASPSLRLMMKRLRRQAAKMASTVEPLA